VVGNNKVPFANILGDKVGEWLMKFHQSKGKVEFKMGVTPAQFVGSSNAGGPLTKIVFSDGTEIEADLCVLGVGVQPNTEYISGEVEKDSRGYVRVNENLQSVSVSNVYAIGDIANFPLCLPSWKDTCNDYTTAIGHWQIALSHGKTAGLNIGADKPRGVKTVPFFWTMQYGKSLRYAGHVPISTPFDEVIINGKLDQENFDSAKFVAYYICGGTVAAVATLMRDPVAADFANMTQEGKTLTKEEARDPEEAWRAKYSIQAKA